MRAFLIPLFTLVALSSAALAPAPLLAQSGSGSDNGMGQRETTLDQMTPGMARATIVGLQEELIELGYRPGAVDGIMGPRTRSAIRAYQRTAGLPVTGRASKELLDHMKFSTPKAFAREAQSDPLVAEVQKELAERGYYQATVDGIMGPATRAAIGAYQSDAGLPVDGRLTESLLESLRSGGGERLQPSGGGLSPARQT